MSDRIPFTYGEFYDVPRMLTFQFAECWYLLRSYFDETKDDYAAEYDVYRLPFRSKQELDATPDYWLDLSRAAHLGQIPIAEVGLDGTLRKTIDAKAFARWVDGRRIE